MIIIYVESVVMTRKLPLVYKSKVIDYNCRAFKRLAEFGWASDVAKSCKQSEVHGAQCDP